MPQEYTQLQNFSYVFVEGQTSGSADTTMIFRHNKNKTPDFWIVLEGDVYIPKDGMGANQIDVRSRKTSEKFKLLLFF